MISPVLIQYLIALLLNSFLGMNVDTDDYNPPPVITEAFQDPMPPPTGS